jgi:hypothetical protein
LSTSRRWIWRLHRLIVPVFGRAEWCGLLDAPLGCTGVAFSLPLFCVGHFLMQLARSVGVSLPMHFSAQLFVACFAAANSLPASSKPTTHTQPKVLRLILIEPNGAFGDLDPCRGLNSVNRRCAESCPEIGR